MTRDLFPLVVIDRAFDLILTHGGKNDVTPPPSVVAWCAVLKPRFQESEAFREWLREGFDLGVPADVAAASLVVTITEELGKLFSKESRH